MHISSTFVSLIHNFHTSGKPYASHPKVDNPKQNADYRPVSVLPTLSKVFERLTLKQLVHYIDEQSLLLPSISGFRKGQYITTVLLGIRDDLIRAMKRGEVTMMVMADYLKAFDTVRF